MACRVRIQNRRRSPARAASNNLADQLYSWRLKSDFLAERGRVKIADLYAHIAGMGAGQSKTARTRAQRDQAANSVVNARAKANDLSHCRLQRCWQNDFR